MPMALVEREFKFVRKSSFSGSICQLLSGHGQINLHGMRLNWRYQEYHNTQQANNSPPHIFTRGDQ